MDPAVAVLLVSGIGPYMPVLDLEQQQQQQLTQQQQQQLTQQQQQWLCRLLLRTSVSSAVGPTSEAVCILHNHLKLNSSTLWLQQSAGHYAVLKGCMNRTTRLVLPHAFES